MALRIVYGAVILSFSCTFSKLLHLLLHPVFYFTSCYQYYSLTKRVVQASRVQTKQACLLGRHGCRLENSTLEFVLSGMRQDLREFGLNLRRSSSIENMKQEVNFLVQAVQFQTPSSLSHEEHHQLSIAFRSRLPMFIFVSPTFLFRSSAFSKSLSTEIMKFPFL
uniref:Uncharacterized protein n=1 Tax=Salix viminalis TaxID=40686 RepID=A0A6N2N8Q1_SALVM